MALGEHLVQRPSGARNLQLMRLAFNWNVMHWGSEYSEAGGKVETGKGESITT